jgi:hypothetical protein
MTTKHLNMSEQTRLKHGRSNDEHAYFFRFLLISPSYQLAHRFATGEEVTKHEIARVKNWDLVLTTYSQCGNVFDLPFLKWWDQTGCDLFYKRKEDGTYTANGPIPLLVNKINELTLDEALRLIETKPYLENVIGKKAENWSLGASLGIKSQWVKQIKVGDKKTPQNLEARTKLGILVSKKLKEALYLAENAARGNFPSLEPIDSGLKFDYVTSYVESSKQRKLHGRDCTERHKLGLHIPSPKRFKDTVKFHTEKIKLQKAVDLELKKLKMMP